MRRLAAKVSLCAVMVAAGWLGPSALAQNREKAWELNPYAGYLAFSKVEGEEAFQDTWDVGFRFGYHWTKHHEVEFGFFGASTDDGEDLGLSIDLLGGEVNYIYNFFMHRRDKIVGFVTAGAGLINVSSFGFVSDPEAVGDTVCFSYNAGAGIRFFGGERAGFRVDVRRVQFTDQEFEVNYTEGVVGMTIVLGGAY
jgi:hypothetical protein